MAETKRQDLPTGLLVIATPIGNLADLTPRALSALCAVDLLFCEDTRRARALYAAIGERPPRLERLDAHASPERVARAVEEIVAVGRAGVVTDAGTPGISDPAAALVSACRSANLEVTPIPGVSALTALLSVAGISETSFTFRGFFPRARADRVREIESALDSEVSRSSVWYESAERIEGALDEFSRIAPSARLVVGKELTKIHERWFSGGAPEVAERVRSELSSSGRRGEWCFVATFPERLHEDSSDWAKALALLIDAGLPASDSARRVSQAYGTSRKRVYEAALALVGKKSSEGG